jgi:ferredoxin
MPKITFMPDNKTYDVKEGLSVLAVAKLYEIDMRSDCEFGYCGTDPIRVLEGIENLSAPVDDELENLKFNKFPQGIRMACSAKILGDVIVEKFNL